MSIKTKIKHLLNENVFVVAYTVGSAYLAWKFVNTDEGRANLYETFSLGMLKVALFLSTVAVLTKMLQGLDTNIKDDLFKNEYTTTATWVALVLSLAMVIPK